MCSVSLFKWTKSLTHDQSWGAGVLCTWLLERSTPFLVQPLNCVSWHLSRRAGHWRCQDLLTKKKNRWHPLLPFFLIKLPSNYIFHHTTSIKGSMKHMQSCWPLALFWIKVIQYKYLFMYEKWFKMPPFTEHFTCVVKMLYNLQFIQALAALSSKFSPDERQAWSTAGALKKVK